MIEVREQGELGAPAETVWGLLCEFVEFIEVLGESRGVQVGPTGEGIGMLRTVVLDDEIVVEKLEELDELNLRTSYSMPVPGPFPIQGYLATMKLTPIDAKRCTLSWSSRFDPAPGVDDAVAEASVRGIYVEGIEILQGRFGA
ncbi:conserved hypothetical protein [Parafrankia sp. EAN1pec]|uniref:SRPBCC family protein n=1 Tax=Parafrankia sp. (strain EAN1pec) TaxID=298653 RepID=UPI0000540A78|nr:conserved hypothetical protein [Frankia sp. EAN1pec]